MKTILSVLVLFSRVLSVAVNGAVLAALGGAGLLAWSKALALWERVGPLPAPNRESAAAFLADPRAAALALGMAGAAWLCACAAAACAGGAALGAHWMLSRAKASLAVARG